MAYVIGVVLALAVSLFARIVGLDRDRAFYPTVMIVIAALYGLFAVMGGAPAELAGEWVAMGGFILLAVLGFRLNLWFVVAALFAHGVFDFFTATSSPIRVCPLFGRRSAAPMMSRPPVAWRGCCGRTGRAGWCKIRPCAASIGKLLQP